MKDVTKYQISTMTVKKTANTARDILFHSWEWLTLLIHGAKLKVVINNRIITMTLKKLDYTVRNIPILVW
jgi:hypothetical protein